MFALEFTDNATNEQGDGPTENASSDEPVYQRKYEDGNDRRNEWVILDWAHTHIQPTIMPCFMFISDQTQS